MTVWAKKSESGTRVELHVTHWPIEVMVIEDPAHVRHFWGQLGRLLDEVEHPEPPAADA